MQPSQRRAQLMIEGGTVQVMPRPRHRWFGRLWTAAWGTAALALMVAGMWAAFGLPAVMVP